MDALQARALLFQRQLSIKNVTWSIPGVEALDNQLAVLELSETALQQCSELSKKPDGTTDPALTGAACICRALVMRDTKERILTDNDVQSILEWGHVVLAPLNSLVTEVSGLSETAIETAKKNLPTTPASASDTSSPASSAEETPSQS